VIVALHSFPKRSLGINPPYSNENLIELLKETALLDFRAVEIGPLADFLPIDGERLSRVLNTLRVERSVHVGGTCDAEKLASSNEEYAKTKLQIINGIKLCRQISSSSLSIHPPFFTGTEEASEELASKAKYRFMTLVKEVIELTDHNHVKVALESFCYRPFIFRSSGEFMQFVSQFPEEKLGILMDVGHLYQMGINLDDATQLFKNRLSDVHIHDALLNQDFRKATHLPIGKGTVDFRHFARLL
jgi:sugar phosphate isomerase/epimerase